MSYTTIATRSDLRAIGIPESFVGTTFRVTITPLKSDDETKASFRALRGIIDEDLDLDKVRRERLSAYLN